MAENKNDFNGTVQSLFSGMSGVLSTKTVVGDAVTIGDTIILPLVDVSFGMAAGAKKNGVQGTNGSGTRDNSSQSSQGGMGVKMSPSAILVIHNGTTKLVNIKNQDGLTKVLDMVPDFVNKFAGGKKEEVSEKAMETAQEIAAAGEEADAKAE